MYLYFPLSFILNWQPWLIADYQILTHNKLLVYKIDNTLLLLQTFIAFWCSANTFSMSSILNPFRRKDGFNFSWSFELWSFRTQIMSSCPCINLFWLSDALRIKSKVLVGTTWHSVIYPGLIIQPHLWTIFPSFPDLQPYYPSFSSSNLPVCPLPQALSTCCILSPECLSLPLLTWPTPIHPLGLSLNICSSEWLLWPPNLTYVLFLLFPLCSFPSWHLLHFAWYIHSPVFTDSPSSS